MVMTARSKFIGLTIVGVLGLAGVVLIGVHISKRKRRKERCEDVSASATKENPIPGDDEKEKNNGKEISADVLCVVTNPGGPLQTEEEDSGNREPSDKSTEGNVDTHLVVSMPHRLLPPPGGNTRNRRACTAVEERIDSGATYANAFSSPPTDNYTNFDSTDSVFGQTDTRQSSSVLSNTNTGVTTDPWSCPLSASQPQTAATFDDDFVSTAGREFLRTTSVSDTVVDPRHTSFEDDFVSTPDTEFPPNELASNTLIQSRDPIKHEVRIPKVIPQFEERAGAATGFTSGTLAEEDVMFEVIKNVPVRPGTSEKNPLAATTLLSCIAVKTRDENQPIVIPPIEERAGEEGDSDSKKPEEDIIPDCVIEREPLLGLSSPEGSCESDQPPFISRFSDGDEPDSARCAGREGSIPRNEIPAKDSSPEMELGQEESKELLQTISRCSTDHLTKNEAAILTSLLSCNDFQLQRKVLVTLGNAAAFTRNQNLLREVGCLKKLNRLLRAHAMTLRVGQSIAYPAVINGVATAIGNLAVNQKNQPELKECIPTLIDFATSEKCPESVQLASLEALTNLSVTCDFHQPYTKVIQQLYEHMDSETTSIQLQASKVLVNLSSNPEMVPHLLAARAPTCLLELLVPQGRRDILLRWLTLLANVICLTRDQAITYAVLPTEYKAPSPEMMYTALYGHTNSHKLRSKVFVLSKHHDKEISYQASRIYTCLN